MTIYSSLNLKIEKNFFNTVDELQQICNTLLSQKGKNCFSSLFYINFTKKNDSFKIME